MGKDLEALDLGPLWRRSFGLEIIHNRADANGKMKCREREKRVGWLCESFMEERTLPLYYNNVSAL